MTDGLSQRLQVVKPAAARFVQFACLSLVCTTGIVCIVASLPSSMKTNPYPTATGPYESQINQKLVELQRAELEYEYLSREVTMYSLRHRQQEIGKMKIELAGLRAKAAAQVAAMKKKAEAMESQTGGCFTADMWVLTADGAKSIADVKVGDRVLSSDAAGRQVEADVIKTYAEQGYHYFLINDRIKVTALHRFFTDHGWKKARELKAGDRIMTQDGRFEEILALEWLAADLDVYNLTISVNHNFYISPDGRTGYLVHNTSGGGGGGAGGK